MVNAVSSASPYSGGFSIAYHFWDVFLALVWVPYHRYHGGLRVWSVMLFNSLIFLVFSIKIFMLLIIQFVCSSNCHILREY